MIRSRTVLPENNFLFLDMCRKEGGGGKILGICTVGRNFSGHSMRGEAGSVPAFRVARDKRCVEEAAKTDWGI